MSTHVFLAVPALCVSNNNCEGLRENDLLKKIKKNNTKQLWGESANSSYVSEGVKKNPCVITTVFKYPVKMSGLTFS